MTFNHITGGGDEPKTAGYSVYNIRRRRAGNKSAAAAADRKNRARRGDEVAAESDGRIRAEGELLIGLTHLSPAYVYIYICRRGIS